MIEFSHGKQQGEPLCKGAVMGLDMYLHAKKYVSGWSHEKDTSEFQTLRSMYPEVEIDEGSPSIELTFTVGYWRKANAIHNWFVQNVQKGQDDCRPYYVEAQDLIKLREACQLELLVPAGAGAGVLDPVDGFFFGNAERDDWYYDNINRTIKIVDKCLALPHDGWHWSFEYQSSW
jgi:uncharacterized protein YneR